MTKEVIASYRSRYHDVLKGLAGKISRDRIIVDKSPLYISYLGLIQRFFPDARVIVIHQEPRDVCLSCFMQDFALTPSMQNFLTFENTVSYYDTVMSLFQHYKENLSLKILEVHYEMLISNFREETDKMLSFLGVNWEEQIDSFHEQAGQRFIQTPSYKQVVQPLYSSSSGRWHNYAEHNAPYLGKLLPHIERLGYQPPKSSK